MSTSNNLSSEPSPSSNLPHHGATSTTDPKPDPYPTFSPFFTPTPSQSQRSGAAMDLSSNMDAQSSFSSAESATHPGSQSGPLLGATPSQFVPNYPSFGNIQGIESMPGSSGGGSGETQVPKLVVVDNLLDRVMRTTKDAREAYSRGRDHEGNQRIAELKAVVELVSTFVIPNAISASTPSINTIPSLAEHRVSPPSGRTASRKASLSGPTPQLQAPTEDASRKRCASAQGDRVLKSLKLEANEESTTSLSSGPSSSSSNSGMPGSMSGPPSAALSVPPATSAVLAQTTIPPPLLHSQTFPGGVHSHAAHQARQQHMAAHLDPLLSAAYSTPTSSRSESSSGGNGNNAAMAQQLALLQQQQQQHVPPHPHPLQHSHSHPHPHPHPHSSHHAPTVHSPLGLSTPKISTVGNGNAPPPTGWSDTSMISPLQGLIPPTTAAQAQAPRFRAPGPADPGSHSASFHSLQHPHPVSTHAPLPPPARPSRSASHSGTYPFAYGTSTSSIATTGIEDGFDPSRPSTSVSMAESSSPDLESDRENSPGRLHGGGRGEGFVGHHPNNEIPPELKADVDRIFFQFLSMTCSDLEATDSKGEPIHQPLMAKKMQRLDESPDFRPFKFRIQAFTNGFLEELAKQGLSEDVIPMKKVRHYLWTNAYISRFNEDGKKAKSKGNHIWNIDAKKASEGGWHFRPFRRKIAGTFPGVAYVGLKWQFHPRVWDPQASRSNLHVRFSSPSLPSWLSWNGDVLSGTPSSDNQSTELMVEARFTQEGKEVTLSQKYFLSVAPLSRDEPTTYMGPRRPSLVGERRGLSDSGIPRTAPSLITRPAPQPTAQGTATPCLEILSVVTEALNAVSLDIHSVHAAPNPDPQQQIQLQTSLNRQEQVLAVTARAINSAIATPSHPTSEQGTTANNALARAGTEVVLCALHKVAADHSAAIQLTTGIPAEFNPGMQEVTMHEVSSATKTAVAQAVEQTNTLTSPIDVMLTAETIIQRNTQSVQAPISGDPSQYPLTADVARQHVPAVSTALNGPSSFPAEMSILPDFPMTDVIPS